MAGLLEIKLDLGMAAKMVYEKDNRGVDKKVLWQGANLAVGLASTTVSKKVEKTVS